MNRRTFIASAAAAAIARHLPTPAPAPTPLIETTIDSYADYIHVEVFEFAPAIPAEAWELLRLHQAEMNKIISAQLDLVKKGNG